MSDLFARVKFYLDDHAQLLDDTCYGCADDLIVELKDLSRRVGELQGEWEAKVAHDGPRNAAAIIASMLRDWKVPGAVWYEPSLQRFRLVGECYKPSRTETCCGVYLPGAAPDLLAEDFAEVMRE